MKISCSSQQSIIIAKFFIKREARTKRYNALILKSLQGFTKYLCARMVFTIYGTPERDSYVRIITFKYEYFVGGINEI